MVTKTFSKRVVALICAAALLLTGLFAAGVNTRLTARAWSIALDGLNSVSGYDYIINGSAVLLTNASVTSDNGMWKIGTANMKYGNDPILYYDGAIPSGWGITPGTVKVRFYDCVVGLNNETYDLVVTLSNIYHVAYGDYYGHVVLTSFLPLETGTWMSSVAFGASPMLSSQMDVTYQITKHNSDEVMSGIMLLGFTDIDQGGHNPSGIGGGGGYIGEHSIGQEGVTIQNGVHGNVHLEPICYLNIKNNNQSFFSKQPTSGVEEERRAGLSFGADASGTKIAWSSTNAFTKLTIDLGHERYQIDPSKEGPGTITPDTTTYAFRGQNKAFVMKADTGAHIKSVTVDGNPITVTNSTDMTYTFSNVTSNHAIHVVFEKDPKTVRTYVRYRDVNGNWGPYSQVDSRTVAYGDAYSYTWTRPDWASTNVYYDANPATVSEGSVTADKDFYMDVERKKYTYSFNANPPGGHDASEVSNMQANKSNWWAETMSGGASSPGLTGYTFLGWNTSANGAGGAYANEKMLSDKAFYALWRANQYYVKYDPNGGSNPDHLEGEFTQNAVSGTMDRSTYQYDVTGALRPNAFAREGYEFIGWNTRADGTGTAYPDGYNNVLNWTSADGGEITLYAQWRKKLGNETLTVVSEETGNPVPGVHLKLYKKVNGTWTEVPGVGERVTDENGQTSVSSLHWFDYEWRSTSVPDGYLGMTNVNYQITYNHLSQDDVRILYMRHVSLVLDSTVSDVIKGEDAPAFLYHVSGTDVAGVKHEYDVLVKVGSNKKGTNGVPDMFAGTYDITQLPVSRYVPGNAKNVSGATPNGINAKADLRNVASAEALFPYTIRQYGGFSSVDAADNAVRK